MAETSPFAPLIRTYFEQSPSAAARILETMSEEEVVEVPRVLPSGLAARAVQQLQSNYAATLLNDAGVELVKEIVKEMEPEHAASILLHLSEEARARFLEHLPRKRRREIREQLTFPKGSVGRLMSRQFLSLRKHITAKSAIARIRLLAKKGSSASYAYVVDERNHLAGVMNMRELMLAEPEQTLAEIIQPGEVFTLDSFMSSEDAASELSKRRYFAAPVVDAEKRLLGVVRAEQLIQGVREDAAEDIQKMFGVGGDEEVFSPISYSLRQRLPWLHVNLATAFMAAAVVAFFEDIIAKITVLAVFLPIVAGQGGNAGAQSLAIVMRGLVMREIPKEKQMQLVMKEALIGTIGGLITGLVTALVAWVWQGNAYFGVVIGLGMIVNLAVAGLAGASIPLLMRAAGLDPAQCSNILLTTVTDVIGFFAFLGFAVLFQSHLIK